MTHHRFRRSATAVAALTLILTGGTGLAQERSEQGDVLLIEKIERARGMNVPRQGMRMNQVEASFGEPLVRSAPVGEPPITRWRYDGFTVYFERDRVLHAVVHNDALGLERSS